jgi:hypothetical protein
MFISKNDFIGQTKQCEIVISGHSQDAADAQGVEPFEEIETKRNRSHRQGWNWQWIKGGIDTELSSAEDYRTDLRDLY